jgi:succinate-semialdehyde dehydrogenase / glutarate-semialdehyde dehydrogenase
MQVMTDVPMDALVMTEETFGPLAPLIRFSTEEQAITIANDTRAGLAAYFYSRDIGRCFRVGEALEYGMCVVIAPNPHAVAHSENQT